jgi:hypothetical protein
MTGTGRKCSAERYTIVVTSVTRGRRPRRIGLRGHLPDARRLLSGFRRGACPPTHQRGDTVTVAYDAQQVNSVELASRVVGRHPLLDPWVLALMGMSVLFLAAAAVNALNMVLGP